MIYTLDKREIDFWNHAGSVFGGSFGAVVKDVMLWPADSTPNMVSIRENELTPFAFNGLLAATEANTVFAHTTTIKATQERLLIIGGVLHAQLLAAVSVRIEDRKKSQVVSHAEIVYLHGEVSKSLREAEEFVREIQQFEKELNV